MSAQPGLCVVHLVRRGGSVDSLAEFVASYTENDPGVPHRLVLLLKGFRSPEEVRPYARIVGSLVDDMIEIDDAGFDLTAYAAAARRLDCEHLCFLNSHSVILSTGWLAKLQAELTTDVGIVGATGTWTSSLSLSRCLMRMPSAYSDVYPDRAWLDEQLNRYWTAAGHQDFQSLSSSSRFGNAVERYISAFYTQLTFRGFPAPHLRTNAFLIRAETMRNLKVRPMRWKQQAWRLESGRGGITSQIEKMGQRALVVGRDGTAYGPKDWHRSATFWQGAQQNLLVADNQTSLYQSGDMDRRILLSRLAWGRLARPLVGGTASIDASAKRE